MPARSQRCSYVRWLQPSYCKLSDVSFLSRRCGRTWLTERWRPVKFNISLLASGVVHSLDSVCTYVRLSLHARTVPVWSSCTASHNNHKQYKNTRKSQNQTSLYSLYNLFKNRCLPYKNRKQWLLSLNQVTVCFGAHTAQRTRNKSLSYIYELGKLVNHWLNWLQFYRSTY